MNEASSAEKDALVVAIASARYPSGGSVTQSDYARRLIADAILAFERPALGHGPDCQWDEDMARMLCGQEHLDRLAAHKRSNPGMLRRLLTRVIPPEQPAP